MYFLQQKDKQMNLSGQLSYYAVQMYCLHGVVLSQSTGTTLSFVFC